MVLTGAGVVGVATVLLADVLGAGGVEEDFAEPPLLLQAVRATASPMTRAPAATDRAVLGVKLSVGMDFVVPLQLVRAWHPRTSRWFYSVGRCFTRSFFAAAGSDRMGR
ncbi:hypothetical protein [Jatrophihabitans sp.]|uniref:hypothetical protein n=1 Tax=Jatrophihabitans sp. TaxID=1932789 RepID=UPI0030C774B9